MLVSRTDQRVTSPAFRVRVFGLRGSPRSRLLSHRALPLDSPRSCDAVRSTGLSTADACLAALYNTFATFTMCRRITPHSSCVVEPDGQLPRCGLRKRTAHQMASDDMSHDDASKHQSPPKRPKRTPTFTRAQSPSSRGPAKKRTKEGQGRRQIMVCGGYTRGKRCAVPHKV